MNFALVTPTRDAGAYLDATVASVLRCLGTGDQYTIVDGGSTDGSVERVAPTLPPNAKIIQDGGAGMYEAIARGFAQTKGELMGWINASDLLLHGALDVVRSALARTGADLVYFDDLLVDECGVVVSRTIGTVPSASECMRLVGWTPLQDGCFWTRSLYERCGGVNAQLRFAGDYDFFLRAFHAGRAAYVPSCVSAFRAHAGQLSLARRDAYARERHAARRQFLAGHPELRGSMWRSMRHRIALSLRMRSGRGASVTPLAGQPWHAAEAGTA